MSLPKILYHYCSIESFYGIISSKNIWLSDSSQSNDIKENTWLDHIVKSVLDDIASSPDIETIKITAKDYFLCKWNPYIFCLSEEGDLLSQWRGYADNARGVSIGFDLSVIKELMGIINSKHKLTSSSDVLHLNKIVYDLATQKETVQECLLKDKLNDLSYKYFIMFKNPVFQEEKEWRLSAGSIGGAKPDEFGAIASFKFRLSNKKIIRYFDLPIVNNLMAKIIKEIIIGSKSEIDETTLHFFLRTHGFKDVSIRKSILPYR